MARPFSLQPLLELALKQRDAAERELRALKARWEEAESRLRELQTYERDYQARLGSGLEGGLSMALLREHHAFLQKLALAVAQQVGEVARRRAAWDAGQAHWQDLYRRQRAFEALAERHRRVEDRREAKQEQKQSDELARGRFHRSREPDA